MIPQSTPSLGGFAPLLTKAAVAKYLGVCQATVGRYAQDGLLPYSRVGIFYRFRPQDVEEFLIRSKNRNGRIRT